MRSFRWWEDASTLPFNPSSPYSFIKDGKVRALAVSIPQRSPQLPDVPTIAETLPDSSATRRPTGYSRRPGRHVPC